MKPNETTKLTLRLRKHLIERAKKNFREKGTSINAAVKTFLEEQIEDMKFKLPVSVDPQIKKYQVKGLPRANRKAYDEYFDVQLKKRKK